MSKAKVQRKKEQRADKRAKRAEKNSARQADRTGQKNPGDTSNDIYLERNSLAALSSLSATETESMEIVTAVEVKRQVSFTHAIDFFVVRASTPPEMSIVYNIFLNKKWSHLIHW
jgi:hypothetical protein